ncbi:hornerin-like [Sinocyclocheilus anshuiensis]|uniref:hornerin-like n=1 Tax=Sinocyclocheilus anshuiensis TaxID=1608454 RepID=UPI0007B8CF58|nr:PREDICTED: hornerin-like [Sinocyclocheilus anshuiensis]
MGQGWKRLSLLVVFLLFWKNADGVKGRAYSNAHHLWGQPSDALSPHAVQSSMSETRVTLPVEEVGSCLFPNKPLKSRSKLNVLQFVKGGSSSYQSTSLAQTAPGSSVSASLPLPPVQQPSSSLMSSGSTILGVASGSNLETQYAASGSGSLVSNQGERNSYSELGISGPSTSDNLHVSSSQATSVHQSADASLPMFSQESVPYSSWSSQAQGSATSQGSSGAVLSASSVQSIPTQVGNNRYSGVSHYLYQSTSAQSSPSVSTSSTQTRYGTLLATSSRYVPVQGGSSSNSFSLKPPGTLGRYAPGSPTKYVSARMSSHQAIYSQTTSSGSSYKTVSQVGSLSQTGASGQFTSQGGNYYSGLLPQSPATSSQSALGYSKLISSPQRTSSQSGSVLSSRKQYASASQGSSGAQFGASTGFASQGMSSSYSGSVQSQDTTGQFAPGSPSSYDGLYCKCALSPQGVDSQSTIQSSRKQFTSGYGTQSGSSKTFTLQGSIAFDGSPQPQGTASQFSPVSPSYPSVSSPSQDVASPSTMVQVSQKQLASTFTGSSGTQGGSSTPFTLQGVTAYGGSPQGATSQFSPGSKSSYASVSLSSPQAGPSTTVQGSRKQFTSTFTGSSGTQAGSSTLFTLQGSTSYGGSPQLQDTAGTFAPGSLSSYASVSLSSPQAVAGPSMVQSSRKQFTSGFRGSSGAQFGASTGVASQSSSQKQFTSASQRRIGASTGFVSQGMSRFYSGSVKSQDPASQFAPKPQSPHASVSLSSPQAGPSTTVQDSRKQFTSTFTGSSGTQAGSSTCFTLLGSTAYGGSSRPQDAASQFIPGSSSPYASVSSSSSQGVASPSSQSYQGYSVSQSQKSQRWQPLATHWTQGIRTSDAAAAASQDSSSTQSSPMQFYSLSSAEGSSSRVSGPFVSAPGGSTSYGGSFQSQSLSTKHTPGSQILPYDPSVSGQGTSSASASEVLSSYSLMNNQNAPAPSRSSSSSRFYLDKG